MPFSLPSTLTPSSSLLIFLVNILLLNALLLFNGLFNTLLDRILLLNTKDTYKSKHLVHLQVAKVTSGRPGEMPPPAWPGLPCSDRCPLNSSSSSGGANVLNPPSVQPARLPVLSTMDGQRPWQPLRGRLP